MRYLELLIHSFRMSVFRSVEYRAGVLIQYVLDLVWYATQFILLVTAYNYVPQVGGYSIAECFVFLGFLFATDAFSMVFVVGGIDSFSSSVRRGTLDFYLLRPFSPLYSIAISRVSLTGLLNVVFTTAFWIFIIRRFDLHYSWDRWLWAIVLFLNGMLVNTGVRLIVGCCSFWTTEGGSLNWLYHEVMRFGHKPEAIYTGAYRYILSSIIPALLLSSWPCLVLIRETSIWQKTYPFLVTAVVFLILHFVWNAGVKKYEGLAQGF